MILGRNFPLKYLFGKKRRYFNDLFLDLVFGFFPLKLGLGFGLTCGCGLGFGFTSGCSFGSGGFISGRGGGGGNFGRGSISGSGGSG